MRGVLMLSLIVPVSAQAQDISSSQNTFEQAFIDAQAKQARAVAQQEADFEHILFEYFQKHYDTTLTLIEVGDASHQFSALSLENKDRLRLMQGAARLNVGLYTQAQNLLLSLLARTNSEYVQANTWFWLAKAGFENQQPYLSERAFAAIEKDELVEFIKAEQWQELLYLTAFARMQHSGDWQNVYAKLDEGSIYPAYIQANLAAMQFNNGDFALAEESFIAAKQSLLTHQQTKASWVKLATERARTVLSVNWLNPFTWFSDDPNAQSQGQQEAQRVDAEQQELDALYDRINLGLAYALLQQQDDDNALRVINTVSKRGGESEQALLTLGWALAQQNRWHNALGIWQYLQQQSAGLYGLQASYAMAYAYQQQGDFIQAFYALDDTTKQIHTTIEALNEFAQWVRQDSFFDDLPLSPLGDEQIKDIPAPGEQSLEKAAVPSANNVTVRVRAISELATALGLEPTQDRQVNSKQAQGWPQELLDIKRMFLSSQPDFDALFLLGLRQEAKQALASLQRKSEQLLTLEQMLHVREQRFTQRQQDLSLAERQDVLAQAKQAIAALETKLASQDQQVLSTAMATAEQLRHIQRIKQAEQRLARLLNDDTRTRPLNPKLKQRLERAKGVLQWQLDEQFISRHWQHYRLLEQAKDAQALAALSYERLLKRQQDTEIFAAQQQSIEALARDIEEQQAHAQAIYAQADAQLRNNLLSIIERRIQALNQQQVNTRLAKLRLQDLTPEVQ